MIQSYLIHSQNTETTKQIINSQIKNARKTKYQEIDIFPEDKKITIAQIRQLKSEIFIKPTGNTYNLYIIHEADTMTLEAQNAILKILEEPPPKAILVLTAFNHQSLIPTIISRCLVIDNNPNSLDSDFDMNQNTMESLDILTASREEIIKFLGKELISLHNMITGGKYDPDESIFLYEKNMRNLKYLWSNGLTALTE